MAVKGSQLRDEKIDELLEREREISEQLFALRLQKVTGQLEKPARMRELRRDLARVLTILREKRG